MSAPDWHEVMRADAQEGWSVDKYFWVSNYTEETLTEGNYTCSVEGFITEGGDVELHVSYYFEDETVIGDQYIYDSVDTSGHGNLAYVYVWDVIGVCMWSVSSFVIKKYY